MHTTCRRLSDRHARLVLGPLRWAPPEGGIDLDVLVRDLESKTLFVLDAKYEDPRERHEATMTLQLRVAHEQRVIPPRWVARGLIVHPNERPGRPFPVLTSDPRVRRTTLARLEAELGLRGAAEPA